jgi:tRNA threonylcarbamoyladenosine biosynthesis protein TsaB
LAETGGFSRFWQRNCPIIGHVLILALDTSSPAGSIAVLRDDKIIGTVSAWTGEIYSSRMFRQVDFLMSELSMSLNEIDLFAVAVGPGSFTGLRVGLTAIKGWAEVYRKPIAAVSALEAVAIQADSRARHVAALLDARRGQVYFALYQRASGGATLVRDGAERVAKPEEFLRIAESEFVDVGDRIATPVPELLNLEMSRSETKGQAKLHVEHVSPVLAPYVGRIGLRKAQQGELADPLTLDANYVRRSDAELHWKAPVGS